ncbi:MAG TPA: hypothetical protein VGJ32_13540 [Solirubrobacteraceae bacterium]
MTAYLASTPAADAAFSVTGDERLDVALPAGAGQACFEANPSPPAFSCLTWGTITKPVPTNPNGTGSANGPTPPNGQSDQRQADDSIVAAEPTAKAPNRSAPAAAPGGATTTAPAFAGASVAGSTAKVDRRGRALVRVRCPAATTGSCRGRLTLSSTRGSQRFGAAGFQVAAGKGVGVRVKLTRAALRRLRRHGRLPARARLTARDAAGATQTTVAKVTLLAPRRRR